MAAIQEYGRIVMKIHRNLEKHQKPAKTPAMVPKSGHPVWLQQSRFWTRSCLYFLLKWFNNTVTRITNKNKHQFVIFAGKSNQNRLNSDHTSRLAKSSWNLMINSPKWILNLYEAFTTNVQQSQIKPKNDEEQRVKTFKSTIPDSYSINCNTHINRI